MSTYQPRLKGCCLVVGPVYGYNNKPTRSAGLLLTGKQPKQQRRRQIPQRLPSTPPETRIIIKSGRVVVSIPHTAVGIVLVGCLREAPQRLPSTPPRTRIITESGRIVVSIPHTAVDILLVGCLRVLSSHVKLETAAAHHRKHLPVGQYAI